MNEQLDESAPSANIESETTKPSSASADQLPPARSNEIQVDDANAAVCYSNFCRVTGTPEELIMDFGLNSQSIGTATKIDVQQRLVMNYFTAKRLYQALGMSILRHETAFGVLETDIQKRVTPALRRHSMSG